MSKDPSLQEYRSAAEKILCTQLINWIKASPQQEFKAYQLISEAELPSDTFSQLKDLPQKYNLQTNMEPVNLAIGHSLLYYLQIAKYVRSQELFLVQQTILEHERVRLNLTKESATSINRVIFTRVNAQATVTDPQKLEQYDCHLLQAIQGDGASLTAKTQTELNLLQTVLGIPEEDIPPHTEVRSSNGVNYIRLWRLLREQNWQAANEETQKCLIAAGSQFARDLNSINTDETINIKKIPEVDLATIDSLWRTHSNHRFGFSVQILILKQINTDFTKLTAQDLEQFGRKVDWIRGSSWIDYNHINFSSKAVEGHLPAMRWLGWWCWKGGDNGVQSRLELLFDRVVALEKTQNRV